MYTMIVIQHTTLNKPNSMGGDRYSAHSVVWIHKIKKFIAKIFIDFSAYRNYKTHHRKLN